MSKTCVVQQECYSEMATKTNTGKAKSSTIDQSAVVWPFLPKSVGLKRRTQGKESQSFPPNLLLRSASLDRIRQFPAYLCRQGSNNVLLWLYNSRSAFKEVLSSAHEQLRGLLLSFCVYLAIGLIVSQLIVCFLVMSIAATSLPSGFIFLSICLVLISAIGMKTIPHDKDVTSHL
ncbi:uncharacterized protein LOC142334307 isoform X2 [Lycorma delicatula]